MTTDKATRPLTAGRKARTTDRKVTRFTLDLEPEQHRFLKLFAVTHGIEASKVMRSLLYLLEAGQPLNSGRLLEDLVLDEVLGVDEDEAPAFDPAEIITPPAAEEDPADSTGSQPDPQSTPGSNEYAVAGLNGSHSQLGATTH